MEIRKATAADLDAMTAIFAQARRFMAQNGNAIQWGDGYPSRELLERDIALGQSYLCEEDGHILATFVMQEGEELTYARIEGAWKNARPYATLHRIAATGERRGMADAIIAWAFAKAGNLRGDTHENNLPMQRAFERNGFERCGVVRMVDGTPRVAYQREK